jgi:hypothetical protein
LRSNALHFAVFFSLHVHKTLTPTVNLVELLLDDVLEGDGVGSELANTLTELLDGHLVLVEVESEGRLIANIGLLLNIEAGGTGGVELLGDVIGGVEEFLEQTGLGKESVFLSDLMYSKFDTGNRISLTEMVR